MPSNAREVAMRASALITAFKRLPWAETPALERLRPEPVEAAQQQVAQAEINLRRTQVRSPVNG
jgi:multidrug resistance efflux pump